MVKGKSEDTIPVVCVSAVRGSHLDLPQKYVGLLMTLTHQEDHQAIIWAIRDLGTNPEEILLH